MPGKAIKSVMGVTVNCRPVSLAAAVSTSLDPLGAYRRDFASSAPRCAPRPGALQPSTGPNGLAERFLLRHSRCICLVDSLKGFSWGETEGKFKSLWKVSQLQVWL